ncbi:MAG: ABC transporter substrate-binding protein [Lachnospiraceae bacterium]|nr:ABC transporter substrate-binding protein [Lachnospiraceae bacterium]
MKKRWLVLIMLLAVMLLTACGSKPKLKIYNAGEYIDQELIKEFKEKYDCKVVYETFESNEMMYTKISSGEFYDIIIPSDYMIERMIKEESLVPIDWSRIENKDNLMDIVMDQAYDPGNVYSVPYFWGSVGILYDTTVVDEEDLEDGWELLRNEKYAGNIYMYDSERDAFMIALKALGYSMNSTNEAEIQEAYQWLVDQKKMVNPIYAGDDVIDNMISGNKAIAVVYSGDGAYIMSENEDLSFFEPEQGTNIWTDAMVISKECQNYDLAYEFINFILDNEIAYRNSQWVGYSSTVEYAYEQMRDDDYEGINAYVPGVDNPNNEVFGYQDPEIKAIYSDLWTKAKAAE